MVSKFTWPTSKSAKSSIKAALARCFSSLILRWARCMPWNGSTRTCSYRKSKSKILRTRKKFCSKQIILLSTRWTLFSRTNWRSTFSLSTCQEETFTTIFTKCDDSKKAQSSLLGLKSYQPWVICTIATSCIAIWSQKMCWWTMMATLVWLISVWRNSCNLKTKLFRSVALQSIWPLKFWTCEVTASV